ncbi:hypothetical protein AB205_0132110 [Aquarana catesbeiana]|uniref:Uncharacterized protein n=2 Tax=Aquarana catesbeiana TaxID=8400 RepID=A0A2G9QBZ6_AQUCT|nr:hypothetical protein AB205_0132110 [Aquarana catesbeiana]
MTSLLSRLDYIVVKRFSGEPILGGWSRTQSPTMVPPPPSPIPERSKEEKILELTTMMVHLLTGEVPIRCQDVTVYFSMEEWEYLEGHKDRYKDVIMEDQQTLGFVKLERMEFPWNENILNLALEILSLLTREDCEVVMKNSTEHDTPRRHHQTSTRCRRGQNSITIPPTLSLIPERQNEQKILELTTMMVHLLTGEVPIRCQDVTVYFSMDEWEYLEVHKDLYKDVMMENQPPLTSPDHEGEDNRTKRKSRGGKSYLCSECGQSFKRRDHLESHVRLHTGETFPCDECGKCFVQKFKLKAHLRTHTGEKLHTCTECGKSFSRKYRLMKHLITHTDGNPYTCPDCGLSFNQKSDFWTHQKVHLVKSSLSCSECGIFFNTRTELAIHQRAHAGKEIYSCSECGLLCVSKYRLIIHQRSHTGERPYACSQCQKAFILKSELTIHQRSHTGEVPFSCPECGKGFTRHGNLTSHMKVHTGEKPFSCPECGKSFSRRNELVMHLSVHTGDYRFSCLVCGKGFSHKEKFSRHQRTHTGVRP